MKVLKLTSAILAIAFLGANQALASVTLNVTVTNNGPSNGVAITPLWAGFHDGSFDSYDGGLSAELGLEVIAEDGNPGVVSSDFIGGYTYIDNSGNSPVGARVLSSQAGSARVDGVLGSPMGPPPIQAGESVSAMFTIATDGSNQYFSYLSMVLPSNDFFVANGNPFAHSLASLYDGEGEISFDIGLPGTVNDAGTEAESYVTSAANGLFGLAGGQGGPDTPTGSLGLPISNVVGSLPLDALNFIEGSQPGLDFNNADLYPNGIATITITAVDSNANAVPEPTTLAVWGVLALIGGTFGYRRQRLEQR